MSFLLRKYYSCVKMKKLKYESMHFCIKLIRYPEKYCCQKAERPLICMFCLLQEITRTGSIQHSIHLFRWMKNQKNYCARNDIYNMMIRLHARHNWTDQARGLFFEMQEWRYDFYFCYHRFCIIYFLLLSYSLGSRLVEKEMPFGKW